MPSMNGILSRAYDPVTRSLRVTVVSAPSTPTAAATDAEGILNQIFDEATNSLRIVLV